MLMDKAATAAASANVVPNATQVASLQTPAQPCAEGCGAADRGQYRQTAGAIAQALMPNDGGTLVHTQAGESLSGEPVEQQWKTCGRSQK